MLVQVVLLTVQELLAGGTFPCDGSQWGWGKLLKPRQTLHFQLPTLASSLNFSTNTHSHQHHRHQPPLCPKTRHINKHSSPECRVTQWQTSVNSQRGDTVGQGSETGVALTPSHRLSVWHMPRWSAGHPQLCEKCPHIQVRSGVLWHTGFDLLPWINSFGFINHLSLLPKDLFFHLQQKHITEQTAY